jgi:predicted unusual protein kinase regulating ubiquinone biosynthesis (AarF/ABC1/UbiB family)
MVERFNAEMAEAMRKDPIVEAPSDLVLVGRVMGLLSGVGKQLDSEVNLFATLMPYLIAQNKNPNSITP